MAEALGAGKPKPDALLQAIKLEFDRVSLQKKSSTSTKKKDDMALNANANAKDGKKGEKKGKGRIDMSTVKCYGCGEKGHFSKEGKCDPAKRKAYEASKPPPKTSANAATTSDSKPKDAPKADAALAA